MTRADFKRKYGWAPQGPVIMLPDEGLHSIDCECQTCVRDWQAGKEQAAELAASDVRRQRADLRVCRDPACKIPDAHEAHDKAYDVSGLLSKVNAVIGERGKTRDLAKGERSMARCVRMFNAATGLRLTARMGWLFMVCLKIARMGAGKYKEDDYIDGVGYMALMGEEARTEHLAQQEQSK